MWVLVAVLRDEERWSAAFPLPDGGQRTLGRAAACDVALNEPGLAPRHLVLRRSGPDVSFEVVAPGLFAKLGARRVRSGSLRARERLTVGSHVLWFEEGLPESRAEAGSQRGAVDWGPFGAFLETLRAASAPRVLLVRLLEGLVRIFEAERGFVLMREPKGSLACVAAHHVHDEAGLLAVSSTVHGEALATGRTVVVENTLLDERLQSSGSVAHYPKPRTVVCAPLAVEGEAFGVIYLDRRLRPGASPGAALPLLETVTNLAAQLLANRRTRDALTEAQGKVLALNALSRGDERVFLGEGRHGRELQSLLESAASQDVTVLVTGETGTGKEVAARAIHRLSARRDGPFVAVQPAALPRELIEAELFGAEQGAYSGAVGRRLGLLELASGGTLFLDEVGDIPLDVQVKLLRVLQERQVTRLGGDEVVPLDFRLVCATNVDLGEAVRRGEFRKDLFYRINVFRVALAPLRERRDEIAPLARHFLAELALRHRKTLSDFSPEALARLEASPWPGNVRELRNAVERAVVVEGGDVVGAASLPLGAGAGTDESSEGSAFWSGVPGDFDGACRHFQRLLLARTLAACGGKPAEAARRLGVARSTLYRHLGLLGMDDGRESS